MTDKAISFNDLSQSHQLDSSAAHSINVQFRAAHRLEVESAHFHTNSAVLLPAPPNDPSEDPDEPLITGLSVLASCYTHAQDNSSQKLLVAGHTDTVGDADDNLGLSSLRAENVLRALTGEGDRWAEIADQQNVVEDYQAILTWIGNAFAWDCDPGGIDGEVGQPTSDALLSFQKRFNVEMEASIPEDGAIGLEVWQAFFKLYELKLAELLDTDVDGLDDFRGKLSLLDDGNPFVGCGETHPIEAPQRDEFRSATNRRVELLFFDPGQEPKLDCHPGTGQCNPDLCQIYNPDFYQIDPIEPDPDERATLQVWLLDADHQRMPDAPYKLKIAGFERTGQANGDGMLTEEKVPLAASCDLAWGESLDEESEFRFTTTLFLHLVPDTSKQQDDQARANLQNLGYSGDLDAMVGAFQGDYGLDPAPWFDQETHDEIIRVSGNGVEISEEDDGPPYDPLFEPIGDDEDDDSDDDDDSSASDTSDSDDADASDDSGANDTSGTDDSSAD